MSRISLWTLIVMTAALSGCSMCCSPFDYCAPVAGPDGAPNCDFGARRNSAFHPMDESADASDVGVDAYLSGPTPAAASPTYDNADPQELPPPSDTLEEEAGSLVR
jgi:hypothetical protein